LIFWHAEAIEILLRKPFKRFVDLLTSKTNWNKHSYEKSNRRFKINWTGYWCTKKAVWIVVVFRYDQTLIDVLNNPIIELYLLLSNLERISWIANAVAGSYTRKLPMKTSNTQQVTYKPVADNELLPNEGVNNL